MVATLRLCFSLCLRGSLLLTTFLVLECRCRQIAGRLRNQHTASCGLLRFLWLTDCHCVFPAALGLAGRVLLGGLPAARSFSLMLALVSQERLLFIIRVALFFFNILGRLILLIFACKRGSQLFLVLVLRKFVVL